MVYDNTGYEESTEKAKIPNPNEVEWTLEVEAIGLSIADRDILYASIRINDKVIGTLRLPNSDYLRWIRERVKKT